VSLGLLIDLIPRNWQLHQHLCISVCSISDNTAQIAHFHGRWTSSDKKHSQIHLKKRDEMLITHVKLVKSSAFTFMSLCIS
jgi:hypothetical protein